VRPGMVLYRAGHALVEEDVTLHLAESAVTASHDREALLSRARTLASIDHPGLERLLGLDFHEGRPFVAAPAARGRRLADRLIDDDGDHAWRRRCAQGVAEAVAVLDARGVTGFRVEAERVRCDGDGGVVLTGWSADVLLGTGSQEDEKVGVVALRNLLLRLLPNEELPPDAGAAALATRLRAPSGRRLVGRRVALLCVIAVVVAVLAWVLFGGFL
jgi:hypothetical protein